MKIKSKGKNRSVGILWFQWLFDHCTNLTPQKQQNDTIRTVLSIKQTRKWHYCIAFRGSFLTRDSSPKKKKKLVSSFTHFHVIPKESQISVKQMFFFSIKRKQWKRSYKNTIKTTEIMVHKEILCQVWCQWCQMPLCLVNKWHKMRF